MSAQDEPSVRQVIVPMFIEPQHDMLETLLLGEIIGKGEYNLSDGSHECTLYLVEDPETEVSSIVWRSPGFPAIRVRLIDLTHMMMHAATVGKGGPCDERTFEHS